LGESPQQSAFTCSITSNLEARDDIVSFFFPTKSREEKKKDERRRKRYEPWLHAEHFAGLKICSFFFFLFLRSSKALKAFSINTR
jgi:hypothetical protein